MGALERVFRPLERCLVVIEAGAHSPWVSALMERCGHEVVVASSDAAEGNKKRGRKNDFRDAEFLARQGRADRELLRPIKHRGERAQIDLSYIRSRDCLVRMRTQAVNFVRGTVKVFGERLSGCDSYMFERKARAAIPEKLRGSLWPLLDTIEGLTRQIKQFDHEVEKLCQKYPETKRLTQVAGVGSLTASAFVLTLEDPKRFPKSRKAGAYAGLVPKQDVSCAQAPQLGIAKTGNKYLRRLLITSAHYILGPLCRVDSDLRRHGDAIAQRGGKNAKKRAAVAVARKLAVLLHRLWLTGETYEPLYNARCRKQRA
jgi:transposase